ncbi:MAG: tetratricopeptide repeat protein [Gammaproteobacteria bacterium]|nr:tetratricopeptide repeat protein [Gammaproteobacteria bacterium]
MCNLHAIQRCLIAFAITSILQACGVGPPVKQPLPEPPPPPAQYIPREAGPSASPVVALLDKAQIAEQAGRLEDAAATLERAVRIDPYDPMAWQMLARVRLAQGDGSQAEAMAARSNSLMYDDETSQRENWRIIAQARRTRGDEQGARAAERQAGI